jgi:hypothetical protein
LAETVAVIPNMLQWASKCPTGPAPALFRPTHVRDGGRYANVVLDRKAAAVAATGEGGRHSELLRSVRAVGRFVA